MKIGNLVAYVNVLTRLKTSSEDKKYCIRSNSRLRSFIYKLYQMGLVSCPVRKNNKISFSVVHLSKLKSIWPISVNMKNHKKIKLQYLGDDEFSQLLITTSKGLKTYSQCIRQNIGGTLCAKVTSKIEIHE